MNTKATDAIIDTNAQILAELAELQAKANNHFDIDPDNADWGHVGSLQRVLDLLKQANGKVD